MSICFTYLMFFSPPRPRSAVAGDYWIPVRMSVCLSVRQQFLFRARSPMLLGGIEWNFAQWKNVYCSCAPGYSFYQAVKNVPVGLSQKSRFFYKGTRLFRPRSPMLLRRIEWNVSQWKNICCSCAPRYRFCRAAKNGPVKNWLGQKSHFFKIRDLPIPP